MGKHAYLIMAHNLPQQLKYLISMLDHEENDIFIHMDTKFGKLDKKDIASAAKKSNVFFTRRVNAMWAGVSLVECELILLKAATEHGSYDYYHLLSGQDLPLKTQDEIHEFFDAHKGEEFVRFMSEEFTMQDRIRYYHLFINKRGRSANLRSRIYKKLDKISLAIQKTFKVDRNRRRKIKYQKGTQWFSITDELARYTVSKRKEILKQYRFTYCPDELFMQTLILNSDFVNRLAHKKFDNDMHAMMRYIDWDRGTPYTFRMEDFDLLRNSGMLFARKFSMNVDAEIVEALRELVLGSQA